MRAVQDAATEKPANLQHTRQLLAAAGCEVIMKRSRPSRIWGLDAGHDIPLRRVIAVQLVGDHDAGAPASWLTTMPRQASNSSTMRNASGKRKYSQTVMADDLGREPIAGVAGAGGSRHPAELPASPRPGKVHKVPS